MEHLDDVSVEELHEALDRVEGKNPTQRLLAAIAYKNGVTQTELAEWHDVERRTIYNWLERLDTDGSPADAVTDAQRPGRTRKLSDDQRKEFELTVQQPPEAVGLEAPAWSPALVRQYLEEAYGVEYSVPSCRRLLKEAGLRYRKPVRTTADAEQRDDSSDECGRRRGRWTPQ